MYTKHNDSIKISERMNDIRKNGQKDYNLVEAFNLYIQETYMEYSTKKGLTKLNFIKYLSNIPIFFAEKMFLAFKINKNMIDVLSFEEFSEPLRIMKFGSSEGVAKLIFDILDFDQSGVLSFKNLKILISTIPMSNQVSDIILQPFSDKNKIKFNEFEEIILNTE